VWLAADFSATRTTDAAYEVASHKGAEPMDSRDNPVYWSFSCGNWFMTHVRVSVLVPLVVVGLCIRLHDIKLGLLFGAILFISLLIHEFSHILAVRWTGGVGNEVLIWPLGGLALVQPAGNF
jgi:hypothetical protein